MMRDQDGSGERLGRGMIEIARKRLLRRYPFHAGLVACWAIRAATDIKRMGVVVRDGAVTLKYEPESIAECSFAELEGLLLHEVHHVLFGHPVADRQRYPDRQAWEIAAEVTANEFVNEPLPGTPITLADFPELPPGESTDARYRRLAVARTDAEEDCAGDDDDDGDDDGRERPGGAPRSTGSVPRDRGSVPKSGESVPKSGGSVPKSEPVVPKSGGPSLEDPTESAVQTVDDHSVWTESPPKLLDRLAVQSMVRATAKEVAREHGPEAVPSYVHGQIERVAHGDLAGTSTESLSPRDSENGSPNWRVLLRRYIAAAVERRPRFDRPPRRFPELVGVLPGNARLLDKPRVLTVIDTSGSMDVDDLDTIGGELRRMARDLDVIVVEVDAEIQAVYRYTTAIRAVHGRCGTDLRPALAPAFLAKHRPSVVVYFTDGHGPAPHEAPRTPVIWCLTRDGTRPASWGEVVRLGG